MAKLLKYISNTRKYLQSCEYEIDIPTCLHIKKDALVLDVGGGPNPCLRANVVCDKYLQYNSRTLFDFNKYIFTQADGLRLPFVDKCFDWVITRHTLEHIFTPVDFIMELYRVSKNLCIITPSPVAENSSHGFDHFWFNFGLCDGRIVLRAIPKYYKYEQIRVEHLKSIKELQSQSCSIVGRETVIVIEEGQAIDFDIKGEIDKDRFDLVSSYLGEKNKDIKTRKEGMKDIIIMYFKKQIHALTAYTNVVLDQIVVCPQCKGSLKLKSDRYICKGCQKDFLKGRQGSYNFDIQ